MMFLDRMEEERTVFDFHHRIFPDLYHRIFSDLHHRIFLDFYHRIFLDLHQRSIDFMSCRNHLQIMR